MSNKEYDIDLMSQDEVPIYNVLADSSSSTSHSSIQQLHTTERASRSSMWTHFDNNTVANPGHPVSRQRQQLLP